MLRLWVSPWLRWSRRDVRSGSQANIPDQDCMAVVAAPVVPGEVFGPPSEGALEQSRRARELTRSVHLAGRAWRSGAASTWFRSAPQTWTGPRRAPAQAAAAGPSQAAYRPFRQQSGSRPAGGRRPARASRR